MAMYLGASKVSPTILQGIDGRYLSVFNKTIVNFSGDDTAIQPYTFITCLNLTTINLPNCSYIGSSAFYSCSNLTTISFPNCTYIGSYAFKSCTTLTEANFPKCSQINKQAFAFCDFLTTTIFSLCKSIGNDAFWSCMALQTISFPVCETLDSCAFEYCSNLSLISFPKLKNIGGSTFLRCVNLISLYLMNSSVVSLSNNNAFTSTPIGGYSASAGRYGSIYVPASLLTSYKAATNWTYFSDRFVGV